jgi:hypothetical protein
MNGSGNYKIICEDSFWAESRFFLIPRIPAAFVTYSQVKKYREEAPKTSANITDFRTEIQTTYLQVLPFKPLSLLLY